MTSNSNFFLNIKQIRIAHEFILDRIHHCEYPQGRGHYGLVHALDGYAEYRLSDGRRFTLKQGDTILLSPDTAYILITDKTFHHYTVNFDIHESDSNLDVLNQSYFLFTQKNTKQIERCFKKLVDICSKKQCGYEMESTACLYELTFLFYLSVSNTTKNIHQHRLLAAKEYIEQNYDQNFTLDFLASLSYMSPTHFRREWKKAYSESPIQYRDNIRIYYAKEYLDSGYFSVSETAEKCGFSDVNYFVRFFKSKTGLTPGAYKKRLR